jgi:hypothetical protein
MFTYTLHYGPCTILERWMRADGVRYATIRTESHGIIANVRLSEVKIGF